MAIKAPPWFEALKLTHKQEHIRASKGLYPKRDGWYKSLGGKTRYICKPSPFEYAVSALEAKLSITASRTPIVVTHNLNLEQLVETFLVRMLERVGGAGKVLRRNTYNDFVRTLAAFVDVVGPERHAASIGPDDFTAYIKTISHLAASTRRRFMQYVDRLFNWAGPGKKSLNWIPFAVRGPDWIKPSDEDLSVSAADSDKAYEPKQVDAAFEAVKDDPLLNAAAHLALGSAFSPMDLGTVPESIVDLERAEIRFPRGKTGVARLCPLTPKTVDAIRTWLKFRKRFKTVQPAAEGLLFRSREGNPFIREFLAGDGNASKAGYKDNRMSRRWSKVVGLPLSGLRSTFASIADDWVDQRAVDVVMGHKVGKVGRHIRRHYAKKFEVDRARRLVEHVWLHAFPKANP